MSQDPTDSDRKPPTPFEVFRSGSSARLPGQRFPASTAIAPDERSGPVDSRRLADAGGASAGTTERKAVQLSSGPDDEQPILAAPAAAAALPDPGNTEGLTIRLQTYSVNLAERIARVKAEQKEALDSLQQLAEDIGRGDPRAAGADDPSDER